MEGKNNGLELGDGEIVWKDGKIYYVHWVDEYGVVLKNMCLGMNGVDLDEMGQLQSFDEHTSDWDTVDKIALLEIMAREAKQLSEILDNELTRVRKQGS